METAARCDGPSFWPSDDPEGQGRPQGGPTSGGCASGSDASACSPTSGPTGAAGPAETPFALYAAPTAPHGHLHELSAFLAASGDALPAHGAMSSTLLDELLGATDDMEQPSALAQSAGAARLPASSPPHATARLLQLEDNYERKKKRAKINRKDLNARFQELMELLRLREDRKLNRAKVLEKAIERIEQLTSELEAAKARLGGDAHSAPSAVHSRLSALSSGNSAPAMGPIALPSRRSADSSIERSSVAPSSCHSTTAMVPIAAGAHPWGSAAGSAMSMVWVPCPVMGHSLPTPVPMEAGREASGAGAKRRRLEASASDVERDELGQRMTDCDVETAPEALSVAVWAVHEIPTVLHFCDAWTLASVMRTCKELARAARREELWASLVQCRWRTAACGPQKTPAREQWAAWHASNRMPDCSSITPEGVHFATGRSRNISAWGLLSRRSNGRTTRTVLVDGRATVTQVVELYVVVQNMGRARVRPTDRITVTAAGDERRLLASPFTADSGAHLTPHVVALNGQLCTAAGVVGVALHHGDVCLLSVFLHCEGLDLEDEFLQRAGQLLVQVEAQAPSGSAEVLEIRAQCHATSERQQKRALSS